MRNKKGKIKFLIKDIIITLKNKSNKIRIILNKKINRSILGENLKKKATNKTNK